MKCLRRFVNVEYVPLDTARISIDEYDFSFEALG